MAALAAAARSEDSLALMLTVAVARAFSRALALAAVCSAGVLAPGEAALGADPVGAVLDRTSTRSVDVPRATARAQDRLRRKLGARALLQPDPSTGTPRIVARLDGFLTSPSPRDPEMIALDYVREHVDAFGLDASDIAGLRRTERQRGPDGTVHLTWEQRSGGLPNVDGGLRAAVTSEGRLLNVRGGAIPDPESSPPDPRVSAASAYEAALPGGAPAPNAATSSDATGATTFEGGGRASLVRYRDDGVDRVGWRVLIPASSSEFYDAIVDARTGLLQRRINRVRFDAAFSHFDVNPRAESGVPSTDHRSDWLDSDTRLSGPYAHAISDLEDSISLALATPPYALTKEPALTDEVGPSSPVGSALQWDYPPVFGPSIGFCTPLCSWKGSNRDQNREFSTAQLFWYVNTFHDHLAQPAIGFTGDNEALEGENDRVLAQALDGALTQPSANLPGPDHLNTASMLTLPDGHGALLQVHLFAFGSSRYDGTHDASLVYHEYTHGLTDRLVTDAQGFGAMSGPQPGALSEGLSDFYALDFLEAEHTPDDPDVPGEVRFGKWLQGDPDATGLEDTLRTEGADCAPGDPGLNNECPGTSSAGPGGYVYSDFGRIDAAPEIHFDGEIWAQTLWSLRTALIKHHGPMQGLERVRAYVTDGLRLVPENPTFLDMRNAIVQAAVNLHGDQDWEKIWDVFAERGMGWSASTDGPSDLTPFAADNAPPPRENTTERGAADGTVTDESGAPVAGASVAVAGHDSGLGVTDLAATTGNDGHYALTSVPVGSYPDLYIRKAGFQEMTTGLDVDAGVTTTTNFAPLRRDYASHASGGSVSSFTGPNFGGDGCGPAQALDDDKSTVWSTVANAGPQDLIVDLGRGLDLREVRIDPRAGCGDGPEASLAEYELAASDGPGQPFERIAGGIVGPPDGRGYVSLPLAGDLAGRRLLRLRAIAPRDLEQLGLGPYMDVSELEVTGTPVPVVPPQATPIPSPTPTPTLTPPAPPPVPKATELIGTKLTATLKGLFKVNAAFGDAAPLGTARFTVTRKGKRLARATTPVRQGRTVTKTLKLTRKGRKMIKPGRSRMVRVELRLPSGEKVKKTMKLTRRRR